MASKSTTPTFTLPSGVNQVPYGAEVMFFEKGVDAYEQFRLGSEIEVKTAEGTVYKSTVRSTQVSSLIELIVGNGHRHILTYGQLYTAGHLVRLLTEQSGESVIDVSKLYTGVLVQFQMPSPIPVSPVSPTP